MAEQTEQWRRIQQQQRLQVNSKNQNWKEECRQRQQLLLQLKTLLQEKEKEILAALAKDLRKPSVEAYASEIAVVLNEIDYAVSRLKSWMRPHVFWRFHLNSFSKTITRCVPYGSVLIVSPWNYPLQLALVPLIGAWAAGNRCFLKPSELAPATSTLLLELLNRNFLADWIYVVEGDAETAQSLLLLGWDYLFFTGSPSVGKKIYQAAASQLTPVTLELGGKNPCIIDQSGFSDAAVRKILWGKFLNAGQTCVAPDILYVDESIYPAFLETAVRELNGFYGVDIQKSPDYGRIINERHFQRLAGYLQEGRVIAGGETDQKDLYIAPALLVDLKPNSDLWKEEIFGPILPVVPFNDLNELLQQLQKQPAPLAVYCFTENKEWAAQVENALPSGAFSQNQVIRQTASPAIPFGGVGQSGFGRYHGKESFLTFTYAKPLYRQWELFAEKAAYPPYTKQQAQLIKKWRKWLF